MTMFVIPVTVHLYLCYTLRRALQGPDPTSGLASRVVFDDELFVQAAIDLTAVRQTSDLAGHLLQIPSQPGRSVVALSSGDQILEVGQRARSFADCDLIAFLEEHGRHVRTAAIDSKMPVRHQQARLRAAGGKAESENDIIQPRLEDLQQVETRQATASNGCLVIAAELALHHAIDATSLLLGAQ